VAILEKYLNTLDPASDARRLCKVTRSVRCDTAVQMRGVASDALPCADATPLCRCEVLRQMRHRCADARHCVSCDAANTPQKTAVLQNAAVAAGLLQPAPVKSGLSSMPQFMVPLAKRLQIHRIMRMVF